MLVPNPTPFFYNTLDTTQASITVMCDALVRSTLYTQLPTHSLSAAQLSVPTLSQSHLTTYFLEFTPSPSTTTDSCSSFLEQEQICLVGNCLVVHLFIFYFIFHYMSLCRNVYLSVCENRGQKDWMSLQLELQPPEEGSGNRTWVLWS